MSSRRFDFTEFFTQTATLKSRGYAVAGNGGLSMTPASKGTFACSVHRLDSGKAFVGDDSLGGKLAMQASHAMVAASDPGVANGDILVIGSTQYEVTGYESVTSYVGDYFACYAKEIRE